MIPFLAPERQNRGLSAAVTARIPHWLSAPDELALRTERDAFEAALCRASGYGHAVALSSGFVALQIGLKALKLPPASQILVGSSNALEAANLLGFAPLLVDFARPATAEAVAERITPSLRAVVLAAPFGEQADVAAIRKVLVPKGIYLIEESVLGLSNHKPNAALLGFSPRSGLSLPGHAGALLTDDPVMATRAKELRLHWQADVDGLSAALLQAKLPKAGGWLSLRRSIVQWYLEAFEPELAAGKLTLPLWPKDPAGHAWEQFVVGTADAAKIKDSLLRAGIETQLPLAGRPYLALPLYPELSGKEVQFVVQRLQSCLSLVTTSSSISP
jgi:dTDP-4-amino-4,6-dideoxygalactose transaminase